MQVKSGKVGAMYDGFQLANDKVHGDEEKKKQETEGSDEEEVAEIDKELEKKLLKQVSSLFDESLKRMRYRPTRLFFYFKNYLLHCSLVGIVVSDPIFFSISFLSWKKKKKARTPRRTEGKGERTRTKRSRKTITSWGRSCPRIRRTMKKMMKKKRTMTRRTETVWKITGLRNRKKTKLTKRKKKVFKYKK